MSYEHVISSVVKVVEAAGSAIMVLGGLGAFLVFAYRVLRAERTQGRTRSFAETWGGPFCSASRS